MSSTYINKLGSTLDGEYTQKHKVFTPLRVYSEYSLLTSCIKYSNAIEYCKENNINTIAVADENNMFGILPWSLAMQDAGIKPIIGSSIVVAITDENKKSHIWVYCKTYDGYISLSNLMSKSYLEHEGKLPITKINELKHCVMLIDHEFSDQEIEYIAKNKDKSCDFGIAISRQKADADYENRLFSISNKLDLPIVAAPKFYCTKPEHMLALDAMWCIKNNTYLAEVDRAKAPVDGCFFFIRTSN